MCWPIPSKPAKPAAVELAKVPARSQLGRHLRPANTTPNRALILLLRAFFGARGWRGLSGPGPTVHRRRQCLCLRIIAEQALGPCGDERFAGATGLKHQHDCEAGRKFQGKCPSRRPNGRKNWSSVIGLFNCSRWPGNSARPTLNTATGLEVATSSTGWRMPRSAELPRNGTCLWASAAARPPQRSIHYTAWGGPWFDDCLDMPASAVGLAARESRDEPPAESALAVSPRGLGGAWRTMVKRPLPPEVAWGGKSASPGKWSSSGSRRACSPCHRSGGCSQVITGRIAGPTTASCRNRQGWQQPGPPQRAAADAGRRPAGRNGRSPMGQGVAT